MFPPPCLMWGWCSWGHRQHSSSSKHGELSYQRAGFWSHLATKVSPSSPLNHWQTSDRFLHVLSWAGGHFRHYMISVLHGIVCYQLFSWWLWSQLPWDHWQDSPPCSSGMIPHRSHDHWNSMRWDLAWRPRPRESDSYFVFLPFANNRTNYCLILIKLLGDGPAAHSSLV